MAMLGVRRAVGPDGPRYLVDGNGGALPLDPVRRLVDGVESNGALVIVRTKSSAAATVARALDEAGLTEVMGTLAGDDTVFVRPAARRRRPPGRRKVARPVRPRASAGSRRRAPWHLRVAAATTRGISVPHAERDRRP